MLPRKTKKLKMGVREQERLVYPTHRAFVKRHSCSCSGCDRQPIDFAHLRTAANSGIGRKPKDSFGISLCRYHHDRAHSIGHDAVARENGTTLEEWFKLADEFSRLTTDRALREALQNVN